MPVEFLCLSLSDIQSKGESGGKRRLTRDAVGEFFFMLTERDSLREERGLGGGGLSEGKRESE